MPRVADNAGRHGCVGLGWLVHVGGCGIGLIGWFDQMVLELISGSALIVAFGCDCDGLRCVGLCWMRR
jgi:hypothetical protein